VFAIAENQLTLRRMAAALAAAGLPRATQSATAADAASAVAAAGVEVPLITLACDISNPERMAELRRLRKLVRTARIVVVSPPTDATGVRRALEAGADGVVFESELEDTLAPSVVAVAVGQATAPRRLRGGLQKPAFSHRERQVLGHVATGLTNNEIAEALFLSESTIKSHLSSAFAKLGVRSRKEAAALVLDSDQGLGADLLAAGVPALAGVQAPGAP
jgi:DNA-binding NarL/FixJ family response regulator